MCLSNLVSVPIQGAPGYLGHLRFICGYLRCLIRHLRSMGVRTLICGHVNIINIQISNHHLSDIITIMWNSGVLLHYAIVTFPIVVLFNHTCHLKKVDLCLFVHLHMRVLVKRSPHQLTTYMSMIIQS